MSRAETSGDLLFHGTSLDALASMLADDRIEAGHRDYVGLRGVSLTRSISVAQSFAKTHEEFFDDVDGSEPFIERFGYGSQRTGAVLVFDREDLADLEIVTPEEGDFNDDESSEEEEERVLGDITDLAARLVAVICEAEQVECFRSLIEDQIGITCPERKRKLVAACHEMSLLARSPQDVMAGQHLVCSL